MTSEWTCCGTPCLDPTDMDLGHLDSLKVSMHSCTHCSMRWLNVVSTTTLHWVPVSPTDAETLLNAPLDAERRLILRRWIGEHQRR